MEIPRSQSIGVQTAPINFQKENSCVHVQLIVQFSLSESAHPIARTVFFSALTVCAKVKESVMNIVNFSDARNSLKDVIDRVVQDADVTVITRRDAPDAVVMSLDHYNSLVETVYLLSSPANAAHLGRSLSQLNSSQTQRRELLDLDWNDDGCKGSEVH